MKLSSLIVAAAAGSAVAAPAAKEHKKRASAFEWIGTNEAGGEFGEDTIPGEWGTEFTFPEIDAITTLIDKGMNIFRLQFMMERLTPDGMTGSYNEAYLKNFTTVVNAVTDAGVHAILDPHNYGRFNGEIITEASDFQTFWENLAGEFKDNELVIFDTNNEYHDMDQDLVLDLNQAAIDGIRAAGAKSQYIFVEGNSWSGAWTWRDVNDNLKALTDPQDKIVYQMHQYLDSDGSGTSETCVSTTIGSERVSDATAWLKENNKVGILGEFAGGVNDQCREALEGLLEHLADNTEVWKGAVWWAAGPWWGDYMFNMEPPNGAAYTGMLDLLEPYLG
ncbi:putative endo-beta-1,4-glucanase B [Aspergillus steynii IBT 23096]|uniref:cellulase n=1 Tax=Aspergillus steynii IBT 23096 TaxID=1392250 RepID=A0A2I2FXZ0_9EURO|nr:putative endo-beta-1,4-glucanase B [Aspergillus steynii IBT 23096]PLB45500.1 putative endo-beta-1,4-glucanase B [Aspergillus steynii IBT 23096]